jgi:hypothetical protein
MSITFLVANKKKQSGISVVGSKYFTDVTTSITHTFSNTITEHAVEDSPNFSDHVQNNNNTFQLSGVFSQAKLVNYTGDTLKNELDRIQAAYTFLKSLRDNKERFTLVSRYDVYDNCVVESLTIPVNPESANSLFFDLTIKQVRITNKSLVNIVQVQNVIAPKKDSATSTSQVGAKQRVSIAEQLGKGFEESGGVIKAALSGAPPPEQQLKDDIGGG